MPLFRPARSRVLALATTLAVGVGLLVSPAASAAPAEEPRTTVAGAWHTDEPSARRAAPEAAPLVAVTPPANDLRENATAITSLPYSIYNAPYEGATLSEGEDATCRTTDPDNTEYFDGGLGSIWFKYVSTKRQTLTFSGSAYIISAFVDGPTTDATRISCTEVGFRRQNFVQAEAGKTYYFQASEDEYSTSTGSTSPVDFFLSASAAVPNTTYSSASVISTIPATIQGSTSKIDNNWYEPYSGCDFNPFMGSVWYKYRAPSNGSVKADLSESFSPVNVGVYDSDGVTPGSLLECPDQWTDSGDSYSFDRANTTFAVQAGKTYFLQVSNFDFYQGDFVLKLTNVGTLTAATPTVSGSGAVGTTLTAVPGTWGPQPVVLEYQWLRDGYPISGATDPQYLVTPNDAGRGNISVQVTGTKTGYAKAVRTSAAVAVTTGSLTNSVPTVTGSSSIGGTLTANPGNWGPAPVDLAYQWKRNGTAISGATSSSYVVASADSGTSLTVSVTGTKYGYTPATRTSSAIQIGLPLQTLMPTPTITGSLTVGSTLTANPGTWDSGTTLTYQWKKNNGVYISGATAKTYVLRSTDVGAVVSVSVTSTKPGYSPATKSTSANGPVTNGAVITGATPTITGTATVGQKLTAVPGAWTPSPVTLAYQWKRNGTAISGATAATYTLVAADSGAAITVAVTGSRTGYTAVTKTSAGTTVKAAAQTLAPTPTITGTTKVGSTLTATPGTWDAGTTLAYQWKRSGVVVSGATAKTYVLKAADAGATITVSITSTKPGYAPVTKSSAATAVITGGILTGATPTITGTAKVGQTLTAVPGTWAPAPVALSYQWKRGGVAIAGATGATYKTVSADAGKSVTVTVTGTKAGFTTLAKTSAGKTVAK
ncbi:MULTISPECIES: hypothetical protein [unclassified Rathayibacter]|uniref:hypothetical protein n=1 Tax=unclassified Rathayibacter TaxID=2609250 RepID=UPI0007002065|nr:MULTISPECIES: hypothetical protein [unclassified Rathayibacter]KQQ05865.1 hypothetical protein ASF42_04775 [Rathayibacter sp. Leaf294]KQS13722.1 hypothetical protein ASG06_04785 [Rathayibacter sp. Leaf185]